MTAGRAYCTGCAAALLLAASILAASSGLARRHSSSRRSSSACCLARCSIMNASALPGCGAPFQLDMRRYASVRSADSRSVCARANPEAAALDDDTP